MVIGDKHYKHTDEGPCRSSRRTRSPSVAVPTSAATAATTSTDDSDENVVQIGSDFQAEIPNCISDAVGTLTEHTGTHATLLWSPNPEALDTKVDIYVEVACSKYDYNEEQALGLLLWHKHNVDRALADLPNYTSYPDKWTIEDKVLFEQAFHVHGKNFQQIRTVLREKSCFELVKYYYTWKKTLNKVDDASLRQTGASDVRETDTEHETDVDLEFHKVATLTEDSVVKQKVADVDTKLSAGRRVKDETRMRPRIKCRPPRSMYLSRDDLTSAVSAPSGVVHGDTLVKMTESQLLALRRQVQSNKHVISAYHQRHELDITSLRPSQGTQLINPNWTSDELLLAVQGVRKYGSDFAAIAEVIGNKMPSHVRNFFISYRQRFCLDDICRGEEHIHLSSTRNTKITKRDNAQPAAVDADVSCGGLSSSPPLLHPALSHRAQYTSQQPPYLPHAVRDMSQSHGSVHQPPPPLLRQTADMGSRQQH